MVSLAAAASEHPRAEVHALSELMEVSLCFAGSAFLKRKRFLVLGRKAEGFDD